MENGTIKTTAAADLANLAAAARMALDRDRAALRKLVSLLDNEGHASSAVRLAKILERSGK